MDAHCNVIPKRQLALNPQQDFTIAEKRRSFISKEVIREKTNVLGLGSPELRKWIESDTEDTDGGPGDRALRRKVDFLQVPPNEVQIQSIEVVSNGDQDQAGKEPGEQGQRTIQMTVQISPRRAPANISPNWAPIPSLFSPSRNPSQGQAQDRKSTRLNSSHSGESRMPSSA